MPAAPKVETRARVMTKSARGPIFGINWPIGVAIFQIFPADGFGNGKTE